MKRSLAILLALALPWVAWGQETRFELGQRLRLFERALDKQPDDVARKRALEPLEQATPTFFKGQLATAAGLLDRARLLLRSESPTDDALWAESLLVKPGKRFLDTGNESLPLRVESFYKVEAKQPAKVELRFTLIDEKARPTTTTSVELSALPLTSEWKPKEIREGDYLLRSEVLVAGKPIASSEQTVSFAEKITERIARLKQRLDGRDDKSRSTETATLGRLLGLLQDLQAGRTQETNYPAFRLLREAEELLAAIEANKRYYGPERAGQFWLSLVTGKATDTVRVQIPEQAKAGKPLPLVVAMHGAGGSENMFFDGYGDGLVAKLCEERGWLLVTTRTPLLSFGGGPDVPRIVDALAKIYPVDGKRVYLVGHSMGAAQAVALAGRFPDRFAAVAALGGGGGFKATEEVKKVPFFVGCGERDFALNGARNLHRSLVQSGVKNAVFKAYPNVEHLIIVQLALPEVFRFFEKASES